MKSPSLPLQKAVFDALDALTDLGGPAVYDHVPKDPAGKITAAFPFFHIGEDQVLSDADQCHDPSTAFVTVHGWSRKVGKVELKGMMAAAVLALDVALTVEGFKVIGHQVADLRHLTDADGVTAHGVAVLRYRLAPTA